VLPASQAGGRAVLVVAAVGGWRQRERVAVVVGRAGPRCVALVGRRSVPAGIIEPARRRAPDVAGP
jgi:hypothetical protein